MIEKDLKKLNREEILEIMIQVSKENSRLHEEVEELEGKLSERQLKMTDCGSLAEACLKINDVLAKADAAAKLFLENLKFHRIKDDLDEVTSGILLEAEEKSAGIIAEAKRKSEALLEEARIEAELEQSRRSFFRRKGKTSAVSGTNLRTAGRDEILELLYQTVKEKDELAEKNALLEEKLSAREVAIRESGSLSEACLKLQGVMEAADEAAKQYLENLSESKNE